MYFRNKARVRIAIYSIHSGSINNETKLIYNEPKLENFVDFLFRRKSLILLPSTAGYRLVVRFDSDNQKKDAFINDIGQESMNSLDFDCFSTTSGKKLFISGPLNQDAVVKLIETESIFTKLMQICLLNTTKVVKYDPGKLTSQFQSPDKIYSPFEQYVIKAANFNLNQFSLVYFILQSLREVVKLCFVCT